MFIAYTLLSAPTRILLEHERDPHRDTRKDFAHSIKNIDDDLLMQQSERRAAWTSERGHVRKATIVKSNITGCSSMYFEVASMGLRQLPC
mmetsp:Transcript_50408/g.151834  ORF Transcript_50408/g.151834 Transcript_50408/m.151834 type:complete len:90 (-) Transcript_50408:2208-2477(-)